MRANSITQKHCEVGTFIIFVLQMRKLRHIEVLSYLPQVAQLALWFQLMFLTTMRTVFLYPDVLRVEGIYKHFFSEVILFVIF